MSGVSRGATLNGLRVLVVEDTFLVADAIAEDLRETGCQVIGPVSRLSRALVTVQDEDMDCALLDVNLAGEYCFPLAEALAARAIPFGFLTGYGDDGIPCQFRNVPRLEKPFQSDELIDFLERRVTPATRKQ